MKTLENRIGKTTIPLRRKPYVFLSKRQMVRVRRSCRRVLQNIGDDFRLSLERYNDITQVPQNETDENGNVFTSTLSLRESAQENIVHHTETIATVDQLNETHESGPDFSLTIPSVQVTQENIAHRIESTATNTQNLCDKNVENDAFQAKLASTVLSTRMNHSQIDKLLCVLRTQQSLRFLPKRARTLVGTPRVTEKPIIVPPGEYIHLGLEKALRGLLEMNAGAAIPQKLDVDIYIVGGNLNKKTCFWAIFCKIANLEECKIRVIGIYKGKKKPENSTQFLNAFVLEAKRILHDEGILYIDKKIEVYFRCFIADAPARAFALNHKSHISRKPCSKCKVEGRSYYSKNKNKITRHMVYLGSSHELRSTEDYRNRLDVEHHLPEPSPLNQIFQSLVIQVPFEYMHLVLLGVMLKLLSVWIQGKYNKHAQLSLNHRRIANRRLCLIAKYCPEEYARKPNDIFDFESFKGTELRQILLVSGIIIFKGCLPTHLYLHFLMFHSAIRCLCFYASSERHLIFAEFALKKYVDRIVDLYSKAFLSYNVHGLLHLVEDVRRFGNIDCFSAFPYENMMGSIAKYLRKPGSPLQQISNRIAEMIKHPNDKVVTDKIVYLPSKEHNDENLPENCRQFKKLKYNGLTLRTTSQNNCICIDNKVYIVRNIIQRGDLYFLNVQRFIEQTAFYDVGMSSIDLGVIKVSQLQQRATLVTVNENLRKCFLIPYSVFHNEIDIAYFSDDFEDESYVACVM